ncbi:type III pantothenate kinase [Hymenobacter humi]|uniref:Type III pantothenate kinase n=1 Tax=Hymenobacter humi TaxID=1411620 RepID=A0ABW2U2I0_9BACT
MQRWQPEHVIVASVAEDAALRAEDLRELVPGEILTFSPATTAIPLRNAYATPHTLGADRLAAAVGAAVLRPGQNTLIVDAGTALKCDLVTADGTYHGGSIGPGLGMRFRALHAFTGRLPLLEPARGRCNDSAHRRLYCGKPAERRGERLGGRNQRLHCPVSGAIPWLRCAAHGGNAAFLAARLPARIFVVPEPGAARP